MQKASEILGTSTIFQERQKSSSDVPNAECNDQFSSLLDIERKLKNQDQSESKNTDLYEQIVLRRISEGKKLSVNKSNTDVYYHSLLASGRFINSSIDVNNENVNLIHSFECSRASNENISIFKPLSVGFNFDIININYDSVVKGQKKLLRLSRYSDLNNARFSEKTSPPYYAVEYSNIFIKIIKNKEKVIVYIRDYKGKIGNEKIRQIPNKFRGYFSGNIDIKHNGIFR
ncbi:hypothetical protein GTG28_15415 [Vibrio sp. OCN044]|uniref:Uncharacterized protein n=1 Tax=Vibrio tetraodonis subsp. pristinus TaxID=2695891 RepID=A0A6L8M0N7_9VIBR|nr:hypothetical protein [Vibrio tetraodonis]MYM60620.1 hypothetical protein [Vibrio tetraodonis subsp. pristinus]